MVEAISKMEIIKEGDDRCYWSLNDTYMFSVKSAYLLDIGYYTPFNNMSTTTDDEWKLFVWKLNLPPKIKNFMWRAIMGFVPTAVNLRRHHVPTTGLCEFVEKSGELPCMCFFFCSRSKPYWKDSIFWRQMKKHRYASLLDVARDIRRSFDTVEYEVWVTSMWSMWFNICKMKHGNEKGMLDAGVQFAINYLESFREACWLYHPRLTLGIEVGERKWFPLKSGKYSLDVDAAYNDFTNTFGVGAVVRDSKGDLCAALAKQVAQVGSMLQAELIDVLYGLGLCLHDGLDPIVIFSDSFTTIKLLSKLLDDSRENPTMIEQDYPRWWS